MTLTDALLLALLLVAVTGALLAAGLAVDTKAPRKKRVALTTTDDLTFVGFVAHEDRHRVVLEDAALSTADGETAVKGRQHFRTGVVKRVQEFTD